MTYIPCDPVWIRTKAYPPEADRSIQLSYEVENFKPTVIPFGFEPKTYSLEGCRSIQLSYGTSLNKE